MKSKISKFYKYFNYAIMLCNRPKMRRKLNSLLNYHLNDENNDYTIYKEDLLFNILEYASKHCEYYKNIFIKYDVNIKNLDELYKIPFLTKEIIKDDFQILISDEIIKVTNYYMNTGGTTGNPLSFPVSSHYDYEHQEFVYRLYGYQKGDKILSIGGTRIHEDKRARNIFWSQLGIVNLPYGKAELSALYLSTDTVKHYINYIFKCKPSFLRGYPTSLNYLAVYILENNIEISFPIKAIRLTSETIFPEQILNIEKAFKCKVSLEYGHSEVGIFAYSVNNTYEYYCSPFYGYSEVIDSEGKHVKEGEIGEIVTTGFYNKSLPFIRYKTGDFALFNGAENGITKFKSILGRDQDYLFDLSGQKVFLIGVIYGGHHNFLNHIKKWQVVQNEVGYAKINIIKGKEFTVYDEHEIRNLFLAFKIHSNIEFVEDITPTDRGKNKFIIQNVKKSK